MTPVNCFTVNTNPVVVPAVVVIAVPPDVADRVNVDVPSVAMMKYVRPDEMPVAVPVRAPETTTACPTNNPLVAVQEHCPAVPVTATAAKATPA